MINRVSRPAIESLLRQSDVEAVTAGILYLACLLAAIGLWRRCKPGSRQRSYWLIVVCVITTTCSAEALGLPAKLTQLIRAWSVAQGWYAERWGIQLEGITAIFAAYLIAYVLLKPLIPPDRDSMAVFRGLIMLLMYITIRTVSLHELDGLLRATIAWQLTVNTLSESCLLILVFCRLLFALRASCA